MAAVSDSQDVFIALSSKITQLSYARTKNDRNLINKALDDLNCLNYKYAVATNHTKAVLLVNHCCSLIPPEDVDLVKKCCCLITNLVTHQKIPINGRTLTVAVLWCLHALKGGTEDVDVLVALDALLRSSNNDLIVEVVRNQHIKGLLELDVNLELVFYALQCVEACTMPPEDMKPSDGGKFVNEYQQCFMLFLKHIENFSSATLTNTKIQIVCLRGLQNVIRQHPQLIVDNLGIILGVIKSYSLIGVVGIDFVTPQKLMPSALSIPERSVPCVTREKGGKMTKQRKPKTQPVVMKTKKNEKWDDDTTNHSMASFTEDDIFNGMKTSDSDFSDTEGGNAAKLATMKGRVRQAALSLLLHTIKLIDRPVMFSYWTSFIPENPATNKHNLITCILKETSNKGRMIALNALLLLLSSAKLYLAQAEKGEPPSFTPFSVVLGLTIHELHKCLSLALMQQSVPVLNMVLKCFASLVQATPYHRLSPGLITKTVRNIKPNVFHKDSTVQVTALVVFGCILASEPPIPETTNALIKQSPTNWLLERCLSLLGYNSETDAVEENSIVTPLKMESLQIISVMSRNYFEALLVPRFDTVIRVLNAGLANKHADVQLHAARTVEFIGQALNRCIGTIPLRQCLSMWQTLLNGSLTTLLQCEHPILKAAACDCLGTIGALIFEQLSRDKQILCVTLLFACSRDEENNVKGAAARALGIFVLYPSLREDEGFVVDTAETIHRMLGDENFAVRIKSSWALGNLSDALVTNTSNSYDEFPKTLIYKLLKITIKASSDGDKVKVNTVRALGNFLQLINSNKLEEQSFKEAVIESINVFVKICTSGSNMKIRWNCCYAMGNAMKNSALFEVTPCWQDKVFATLSDLVVHFRNFKVRINAAAALAAPKKREFYKQWYQPVWISLVKGLETSQNIEDLNEYKHRDNLIEQICLSLAHLMTLLAKDDLGSLADSVQSDYLKAQMIRVWERLLPEKASVLYDARQYVTSLSTAPDLSADQKSVLQHLTDIVQYDF